MMNRERQRSGIILPCVLFASRLSALEMIYVRESGIQNYFPVFSLDNARRVIRAVYEDLISRRLIWVDASDHVSDVMEELYEARCVAGALPDQLSKVMLAAWRQALDEISEELEMFVDRIIPANSWHTWPMSAFGNDLLLERGEDYRVIEWERIMSDREQERRDALKDINCHEASVFVNANERWRLKQSASMIKDSEKTVYVPWTLKEEHLEILEGRTYLHDGKLFFLNADQARVHGLIDKIIMLRVDVEVDSGIKTPSFLNTIQNRSTGDSGGFVVMRLNVLNDTDAVHE